ncbi:hypothetical protein [Kitasatospora sp. NPDC059800]|uniref:hypothetical protein n=1 Tax=Kitasatospora sp. NPDC059800 TaxID=3346951 RepID=UPI00365961D0
MRLTPRKEEVSAIVALLESQDFDSADQMAKALLKEAGEILQMRDWYALVHTWNDGHRGLSWAPFGNESEAIAFANKLTIGGTARLVKLYSPGIMLANIDGKKGWKGYCQDPECGHAPFAHSTVSATRGACHIPTCPCGQFRK